MESDQTSAAKPVITESNSSASQVVKGDGTINVNKVMDKHIHVGGPSVTVRMSNSCVLCLRKRLH